MASENLSAHIWSVADLLRGEYKQSDYGKVILPFTVLRRLDCALAASKAEALRLKGWCEAQGIEPETYIRLTLNLSFLNLSSFDLKTLLGDADQVQANLHAYIQGFSEEVRDIFERFSFAGQIEFLHSKGLLYQVCERFAAIELGPDKVDSFAMGLVFEELIRRFAELSNETAGEHFTPREVIALMVNLLFVEDEEVLTPGKNVVRTIYDPTAGTGGMLSVADEHVRAHNPQARLMMYGQELNDESYAICKADMLIKGQDVRRIRAGNTLSEDQHAGERFAFMLSNPPFGVEWKKVEKEVKREHEVKGFDGRFGPGLPRVSDGSLLFLLHLLSKMIPVEADGSGGSRIGIVLNGSPLFTGSAGGGESEIRRHVLEGDLVEAIIGLPTDMFYNTGIATYVWVLTNKKPASRRGKVQLIDGSTFWEKMRKSLGSKRKELSEAHIKELTRLFGAFEEADLVVELDAEGKEVGRQIVGRDEAAEVGVGHKGKRSPLSRIFGNRDFGFHVITVERPQRDEAGKVVVGLKGKQKGKPQADASLRDTENVPLGEDIEAYFKREVLPHAPDAWIDHDKTKIGYEIPFNRHFYTFEPPRPLSEIDADLVASAERIMALLGELRS